MRGDRGRRHVRRAMAALLVAAGVGLTVLAAPASAAPGNSGGAAVCRQWQDLTRADGSERVTAEIPKTTATEPERPKPALKTDPNIVADEEILAEAPREADSAPPSIPSAAAVFSRT